MHIAPSASPQCAFCDSTSMHLIMDFGHVALAGAFLTEAQFADERKYPLCVYFCRECFAVQVGDPVDAHTLFTDYFYFSSSIGTLRDHFRGYAREISDRFLTPASATVLEFGCNDGVLLRPLADLGIQTVIGVDPATNVLSSIDDARITVINSFFTEAVAREVMSTHGPVDIVMANNVYAHITDIQGTTRAVRDVLADDGVFVFEVHYLGKVLDEMQYDMIYHEHLYYYSLLSAQRHFARYGMVVFDVLPVPIHAGSMRFYVCKEESRHATTISPAVRNLEADERRRGFDREATFEQFSDRVAATRTALLQKLASVRASGKRIAGYGASGRANTMIQYCGLTHELIDYVIDDAPAKQGFFTPGSHFAVRSAAVLDNADRPDILLLFAWSFRDEIIRRNPAYFAAGAGLLIPLPEVRLEYPG